MWISRALSRGSAVRNAERGYVSMSDNGELEAASSVNSRNTKCFSPYGYSAAVPAGEEVILVPSNDGQVALGVLQRAEELEPGEIKIASLGGAGIVLKNDGRVIINSRFVIDKEGNFIELQAD